MGAQTNQEITWTNVELGELLEEEHAHVHFERTTKHIALHPYHLNNVQRGINQILKSSVNSYDKELKGFLLAFKNPGLLAISELFYDSPFIHVDVEADFYLFRPTVGSFLKGIVNKKGLDHIVVLVHKTYTISIPKPDDTEEWLGDMVEIGQEVKCYINQIDNKTKPPFICGVLNTDYSQGCRLFDSTLNNTTDVVDNIDTTEDHNMNVEPHENSHIKKEKGSSLDLNVTETEKKRKKKHSKKSKILCHTMSESETEECGVKIKVEKPDSIEKGIVNGKLKNEVFDNQDKLVQNGDVELPNNVNLKIESHKSLKRESSISLDDFSETEKRKKKKRIKKCDSDDDPVFCKDRKDGILDADLSANITDIAVPKKHNQDKLVQNGDIKLSNIFNLKVESHQSLKRESSISLDDCSETEKNKKKKRIKKCDSDDDDPVFCKDRKDGILDADLSANITDIAVPKKHNQDKLVQNGDIELSNIFNLKVESHQSVKRESSIPLDDCSETEKNKKKKRIKKCDSDDDPVFCKDRKDGILDADFSANIADIAVPKKHKKSKKRLKSESEVEDYVPIKIKIEKLDPLLDK